MYPARSTAATSYVSAECILDPSVRSGFGLSVACGRPDKDQGGFKGYLTLGVEGLPSGLPYAAPNVDDDKSHSTETRAGRQGSVLICCLKSCDLAWRQLEGPTLLFVQTFDNTHHDNRRPKLEAPSVCYLELDERINLT